MKHPEQQQETELLTALAERFLELRAADDTTGEEIRSHENDHRQRHERWSALVAAEQVPRAELLAALKETDWYLGAKKSTAVEVTATQEQSEQLRRLVAAMVQTPPTTPEDLARVVDSLPSGFSLGFASEVLSYVHPDAYWELNTPVWQAVELLGFTGWQELRRGERSDYHRYLALRPLVSGLRSALQSAGHKDASFLDVDLLLWEVARKPANFPLPLPPIKLDETVLDDLLGTLRTRFPDFTTFDAEDSSWWRDERVYKNELLELFERELGAGSDLGTGDPADAVHRLLRVLELRLPSENLPQNLLSWRAAPLLKAVLADAEATGRFGTALHDLLRGPGPSEQRVQRFTDATWPLLSRLPEGTKAWTRSLPSLLLMLQSPTEEMLIRTREFSEAAKRLTGKEIIGDGPLTGAEYSMAMRFARTLLAALEQRGLRPLDLIDVQGFLYVVMTRNAPVPDKESVMPEKPTFEAVVTGLREKGLHFPTGLVANYLLALQTRRFVILTGISGTGKTRLAMAVAEHFPAPRQKRPITPDSDVVRDALKNRVVVAVRPDWTDHRGLLGYHNPLTGQYVRTPFLELVMRAAEEVAIASEQGRDAAPFFAILDEMNLARVEHYFSDLLSCLESGEPLHLHDNDRIAAGETDDGVAVAMDLAIPSNLFIVGTVNVDETTYMFSPKVLDRAFTLELNEVDLAGFGSPSDTSGSGTAIDLPAFAGLAGVWRRPEARDWLDLAGLQGGSLQSWLVQLNELLEGEGRHFGYRVANEIARFVLLAHEQSAADESAVKAAFDLAVLQKVLPKINGTQQELQELLAQLFAFAVAPVGTSNTHRPDQLQWDGSGFVPLQATGTGEEERTADRVEPELPRTALKLWRMAKRLQQRGFVSYIE